MTLLGHIGLDYLVGRLNQSWLFCRCFVVVGLLLRIVDLIIFVIWRLVYNDNVVELPLIVLSSLLLILNYLAMKKGKRKRFSSLIAKGKEKMEVA